MSRTHKSAWLLALLSAGLQIVIFPLPNLYFLTWAAVAPLLVALLRAQEPDTLQLVAGVKLLPARPGQAFLLAYVCGILWYAGTCYWIYNTMRQYGGVGTLAALGLLFLFCLYLALYHGLFGLLIGLLANPHPRVGPQSGRGDASRPNFFTRRVLLLSPFLWVAVELARTRITGFPWDLLGITQVDNIPMARIATVTGVYGLSFEIMVVNTAMAAAFVIGSGRGQTQALAIVAGDDCGRGRATGWKVDQSASLARRSQRSLGAGQHPNPAGRRLDQGILRRHAARLKPGQLEQSAPGFTFKFIPGSGASS